MNKQEATRLLALIKVAYPTAYRDMDEASKKATVNMWQMSFADMPYPIMEQAFNHFRMVSKFPPTVAEMVGELKRIYLEATEGAFLSKSIGDQERLEQYRLVMAYTARYKNEDGYGWLNVEALAGRIGGVEHERLGTSGDHHGAEDRLSLMDAGG